MKVTAFQENQRAVLRYLAPVYDMNKSELENAVIELRQELCKERGLRHPDELLQTGTKPCPPFTPR